MHDGRFWSLREVLDHYSSGIVISPSLDASLQHSIPMTIQEKERIIDFLKTLSDWNLISDQMFNK
jgi:cytochrome c peroxidase